LQQQQAIKRLTGDGYAVKAIVGPAPAYTQATLTVGR
jgi:hypothetical protein